MTRKQQTIGIICITVVLFGVIWGIRSLRPNISIEKEEDELSQMEILTPPDVNTTEKIEIDPQEENYKVEYENEQEYSESDYGMAESAMIRRSIFCSFLYGEQNNRISDFRSTLFKYMQDSGYNINEIADFSKDVQSLIVESEKYEIGDEYAVPYIEIPKTIPGDIVCTLNDDNTIKEYGVYLGSNKVAYSLNGIVTIAWVYDFSKTPTFIRVLPDDAKNEDTSDAEWYLYGYVPPILVELSEGQNKLIDMHTEELGALIANRIASSQMQGRLNLATITDIDTTSYQDVYVLSVKTLYSQFPMIVYYDPETKEFRLS